MLPTLGNAPEDTKKRVSIDTVNTTHESISDISLVGVEEKAVPGPSKKTSRTAEAPVESVDSDFEASKQPVGKKRVAAKEPKATTPPKKPSARPSSGKKMALPAVSGFHIY